MKSLRMLRGARPPGWSPVLSWGLDLPVRPPTREVKRRSEPTEHDHANASSSLRSELGLGKPTGCPHCSERRYHRWGHFSGRQRYRCTGCGRTFSDFTGTPLAGSHYPELWRVFAQCMVLGWPVRPTAWWLGVDKDTVFRWRHRLLAAMLENERVTLQGVVELDSYRFIASSKGMPVERGVPRHRARPLGSLISDPGPRAWVLMARARTGRLWGRFVGLRDGVPHGRTVVELLSPALRHPCTVVANQAVGSSWGKACRRAEIPYWGPRARGGWGFGSTAYWRARMQERDEEARMRRRGEILPRPGSLPIRWPDRSPTNITRADARPGEISGDGGWREREPELLASAPDPTEAEAEEADEEAADRFPLAAVRAHRIRFLHWLIRFRGVASKYLDHYLRWHRFVDQGGAARHEPIPPGLLRPAAEAMLCESVAF